MAEAGLESVAMLNLDQDLFVAIGAGAGSVQATVQQEGSVIATLLDWVAVKELKLSYCNKETLVFTTYPQHVNLN